MAAELTADRIQQTVIRSLRLQASQLRAQARSRRMAGPDYVRQRAAMREEAMRCTQATLMILRTDPDELAKVLGL